MKTCFIVLCCLFFSACSPLRNIHVREGQTQYIKETPTSLANDTLVVFTPIVSGGRQELPRSLSSDMANCLRGGSMSILTGENSPILWLKDSL